MLHKPFLLVSLWAGITASTNAGIPCNQFEIVLYDRIWQVTSYWVQDDICVNPNRDFQMLEPDGLAWKTGYLYASGDREEWSSGSRLAVYSWAGNGLTYSTYKQMPSTSPNWWGPDGLTFNVSGDPTSYGSGANELVSIEFDAPAQAGIINVSTGAVSSKQVITPGQDITYIMATGQFATIADGLGTSTVTKYDQQITATGGNFTVLGGAKGMAAVSTGLGHWLSRETAAAEAFLFVAAKETSNNLALYDLAGSQIGPIQTLPVIPKARIPLDGGLYIIMPAFGQIEAVAVDEVGKTIFLGDPVNSMIHVLVPLRLAGDLDKNGIVNLTDVNLLAASWLLSGCGDPLWCGGSDTQHSGSVDLVDLSLLAGQFGQSN